MTTKEQGNIGVGEAIAYFCRKGIPVLIPLGDNLKYDLVIEEEGVLKKVQVKTSSFQEKGKYKVLLSTQGGNQSFHKVHPFDPTKVDYLFIWTADTRRYLIPTKQMSNIKQITPGAKYSQYEV